MKRVFDTALILLFSFLWVPLFLSISLICRMVLGKPVLFKQKRPGMCGKIFTLYKFRTMSEKRDESGELLPDSCRLTSFGKFLRKTSLDELPELLNVLKGEMSLVGPRPLLVSYLARYSSEQARRHEARPGITGWAQINGRNTISWEEKFKLDLWYIDNCSLWLDFKILILTLLKVVKGADISQIGQATMEEFRGNYGNK